MKTHFLKLLLIFQLAISPKLFAQNIAINTTGNAPDTSAMLDITSTTQGFLMPRMTTVQMNAITLPATGLLIFNTSLSVFEVNLGTSSSPNWTPIGASQTGWSTNGNAGTNVDSNFVGTTDTADLVFKVGNIFAGWIGGAASGESGAANSSLFQGAMQTMITTNNGTAAGNIGNLAVGTNDQAYTTGGSYNESFGHGCLQNNAGGSRNLAFGWAALENNLSGGNNNTAIGINALDNNNGSQNIAIGQHSMYNNGSGSGNIAIGYAGSNSGSAALENNNSGSGNVAIGDGAGQTNNTGNNNTIIGNNADFTIDGLSDAVAIGNNAIVGASNTMALGGTGGDAVNVGIGTSTPAHTLEVYGQTQIDSLTTGSLSDSIVTVSTGGGFGGVLRKISTTNFATSNIYSADGALAGNRTMEMRSNYLQLADSVNTSDVTFSGASQSLYNWSPAGRSYFQLFAGTSSALNLFVDGGNAAQIMSSGITSLNIGTNTSAPTLFYTNNIQRAIIDSTGNVGIGNMTTPNSTLQVAGSVSTSIVTVSNSYTLGSSDYTVIFTGSNSAPTFTLPDPTTCQGRMYRLVNASSGATYQDIAITPAVNLISGSTTSVLSIITYPSGNGLGDITNGNTAIIQSDGTNWWRVGL